MENILKLADNINNSDNINDKIKMIQNLNVEIINEKNRLNNILESNLDDIKIKIPIKYRKCSLEELEEYFKESNDINEKLIIYHSITKIINNITDELFEN